MAKLAGSKTEKNLLKSFAGESQARARYDMFAKTARNEGYVQIATIFEETALQEKEHAKRFFKFLEGGAVEITVTYPAGKVGSTAENLKAAAEGEHEEWTIAYPEFAEIAKEEGFAEIENVFTMVAKVEAEHEKRYLKLLENYENGKIFVKDSSVKWQCMNCGCAHESNEAPEKCPVCAHPQAYFQLFPNNY